MDVLIQFIGLLITACLFREIEEYDTFDRENFDIKKFLNESVTLLKNKNYLLTVTSFCCFWGQIDVLIQEMGVILNA